MGSAKEQEDDALRARSESVAKAIYSLNPHGEAFLEKCADAIEAFARELHANHAHERARLTEELDLATDAVAALNNARLEAEACAESAEQAQARLREALTQIAADAVAAASAGPATRGSPRG